MTEQPLAEGVTLAHRVLDATRRFTERTALRWKEENTWREISYGLLRGKILNLAAAFKKRGVRRGDRICIWIETCWQWIVADFALQLIGAITVPVYHSLSADEAKQIFKDCEAKGLVSHSSRLQKLDLSKGTDWLLVSVDGGPTGIPFDELSHEGERSLTQDPLLRALLESPEVKPEDISAIIYTSGTTGEPKGAVLTHANVARSCLDSLIRAYLVETQHTMLLHLPMAHIMARNVTVPAVLFCGGTVAIAENNREKLPLNFLETRPTAFVTVPYVLDKFMAGVLDRIQHRGALQRMLAKHALTVCRKKRLASLRPEGGVTSERLGPWASFLDSVVLKKMRMALGGQLILIITGGANSNRESIEFFWGLGIPVYEGYGATEITNAALYTTPHNIRLGTVGKPPPGVEVKLASDGEVLIKGPSVMKGYWNRPRETEEAIDSEGWYHSGDIGEKDKDGYFKIIDRKKEIFALATGKNVAPQKIENTLRASPFILQACSIGDRRRYMTALVVPNLTSIQKVLGDVKPPDADDPRVKDIVQKEINRISEDLSEYERIKKFHLIAEPFTLENQMLTPTLKLKRKAINKTYASLIDSLYEQQSQWVFLDKAKLAQ